MVANIKSRHISNNPRLKPLSALSEGAASVFSHVVSSVDPDHFSAVDAPLLESYANAAALATRAAQEIDADGAVIDGKASPWLAVQEKAGKQLVALSARLRICPQSRFDRLVAGANSRQQHHDPASWDDDDLLARAPDEHFFQSVR